MLTAVHASPTLVGSERFDWAAIALPPCVNAVREGADTPLRRARVTRAYYAPQSSTDHKHDRTLRYAAGQVVVVAPDGSVLATWQARDQLLMPETAVGPELVSAPGPVDFDELVTVLRAEGVRVEYTTRHLRVLAPAGPVYLPALSAQPRTVRHSVALLRWFGCTLRHDH